MARILRSRVGLVMLSVVAAGIVVVAAQRMTQAQEVAFPDLALLESVPEPLGNPTTAEKVELGRLLFFDPRMSADGSLSCNSCHSASTGFAAQTAISFAGPGTSHWRNVPTIVNVGYYSRFNRDGSKKVLDSQAAGAWGGSVAGNLDSALAEERLAQIPQYVQRFRNVFGTEYPHWEDALRAVAAYQRTIVSNLSPLDDWLAGDTSALSDEAQKGLRLFTGKAQCISCHNGALISDDSFHALGVPQNPVFLTDPLRQITFRFEQLAKGVSEEIYRTTDQDLGLFYVTKLDTDKGKFKTPSLRDVCYTAPYMHNGVFATLEEVVDFYDAGGGPTPNPDPLLRPLGLSDGDKAALLAFLRGLCGDPVQDDVPQLPAYGVFDEGE
ncbi:MAG: cytochrome-c peroxidase [Acidimicrobiia bacterium]